MTVKNTPQVVTIASDRLASRKLNLKISGSIRRNSHNLRRKAVGTKHLIANLQVAMTTNTRRRRNGRLIIKKLHVPRRHRDEQLPNLARLDLPNLHLPAAGTIDQIETDARQARVKMVHDRLDVSTMNVAGPGLDDVPEPAREEAEVDLATAPRHLGRHAHRRHDVIARGVRTELEPLRKNLKHRNENRQEQEESASYA